MPKKDGEVALRTNEASQANTSSPAANFAQNLVDGKFWGQLLLYPLRQLPEDFDNLSRKIHIVSSTIRTLSAVVGIIAGGVAVFYWPWLSGWVSSIVSAYFGETIAASTFGGIIKAYVGGMLVGSVSKFSISDVLMRLVNGCVYGNPDYYLTKSDIRRLSDKFSTTDIDISEEEVEEMGRSLIAAIESNAPIPGIEEIGGRDVYITIFKNFLAGDISSLNQVIEIQEAVDNQLEEAERKLEELLHLSSPAKIPVALAEEDDDLSHGSSAGKTIRRSHSAPSLALDDDMEKERHLLQPTVGDAAARWHSAFQSIRRRRVDRDSLNVEANSHSTEGGGEHFANDLLRRIEEAKAACRKARNQRRRPIICGSARTRDKLRRCTVARRGAPPQHDDSRDVIIDIHRLQGAREEARLATRSPLGMLGDGGEHDREVVAPDEVAVHISRRSSTSSDGGRTPDGARTPDLEEGMPRRSPSPTS